MIFSSSTQYAIRGLAELAVHEASQPVMLDRLVAGMNLPRDFLAKVFQKLVRAQVLRSVKGRGGGFSLNRPAMEITLLEIIEAVDGPLLLDSCVVGLEHCNDLSPCPQHDLYKGMRERWKEYLTGTTLAELAESLRNKVERQRHISHGSPSPESPGSPGSPSSPAGTTRRGTGGEFGGEFRGMS